MNTAWFSPLVDAWSAHVALSAAQRRRATDLLAELSLANGGEVLDDAPIDDVDAAHHAVRRAVAALARRSNRYAAVLAAEIRRPSYQDEAEAIDGLLLPLLEPRTWKPALDVNTADVKSLASLPGIGKVIAERIVSRRNHLGPLRSLDDLDAIAGIGPDRLDDLRPRVYFDTGSAPPFTSPAIEAFISNPTFDGYVELIGSSAGSFRWPEDGSMGPADRLLDELSDALEEVRSAPASPTGTAIRASAASGEIDLEAEATRVAAGAIDRVAAGALLRDHEYVPLVESLAAETRQKLLVAMFFMRFVEGHSHPTDGVIAELVAARGRGADVRVILDQDRPGDVFHSRLINQSAFDHLAANGVPVRFDKADRLMHSKVVIADDAHVLVGSHNWTAGSFRNFDDTSVYFQSPALAASYTAWFEDLWAAV